MAAAKRQSVRGQKKAGRTSDRLFKKKRRRSVLLDRDVVGDVRHAFNRTGDLCGAGLLLCGINEAAELNVAFERGDVDLHGLNDFVLNKRGLHLGGDSSVIDVLAGALASRGSGTSGKSNQATRSDGEEGNEFNGVFHKVHRVSSAKPLRVRR